MTVKKEHDLVRLFCEGGNKVFKNIPCEHYISSDRACRLLRQRKTKQFWKRCRLDVLEWICKAADKYLVMYKNKYPGLPIDEKEYLDFSSLIDRLRKQRLEKDTLISWISYVNTAVYRSVRDIMNKIYKIPTRRRCGNCKYFPESWPYICAENGEERKKGDAPCEAYSWEPPPVVIPKSIDEDITPAPTPETFLRGEDMLPRIIAMLIERVRDEKQGSKKRDVCKRQYEIFSGLLHEFSKIEPECDVDELIALRSEAIDRLAEKYGVSRKTVMRDIEEILKFLEEKMSLSFKNGFFYEQGGE